MNFCPGGLNTACQSKYENKVVNRNKVRVESDQIMLDQVGQCEKLDLYLNMIGTYCTILKRK